ncbi:hypothetical protein [Pyxidicoccus xibeiensis]|uniref:hypothetical protein n=1 Tax=Pyxidicoccus xibeiensis TaxID=2906759 RepID=UPI0020A77CCF|nr:hypothetical protein [Pyxidicoccus xibeiensis]MCP3137162.1 hypothetical protein [Pyxidicoccus xibeiensis]
MHKGYIAVALVAVTWGSACASRSKGAEAGEPGAVTTMEAEGSTAKPMLDCSSEVKLQVDAEGSHKSFKKPAPWTLCSTGTLKVTNTLATPVCVVITDSSGGTYATHSLAASTGEWTPPSLSQGDYTVGVCNQKEGADCSQGCKNLTDSASAAGEPGMGDTIKGNLVVVTSG